MKCLEFFEIELNRIFNFRVNVKFVFFKGVGEMLNVFLFNEEIKLFWIKKCMFVIY